MNVFSLDLNDLMLSSLCQFCIEKTFFIEIVWLFIDSYFLLQYSSLTLQKQR